MTNQPLIVALRPELTLASGVSWPIQTFHLLGDVYRDVGLGEWTGFYDWLRQEDGRVIGVRYLPTIEPEPLEPLLEVAKSRSYAEVHSQATVIDFFFSERRTFDNHQSADQAFLYSAVYLSDSGVWAIAFDVDRLSPADLDSIRSTAPRWESLNTA